MSKKYLKHLKKLLSEKKSSLYIPSIVIDQPQSKQNIIFLACIKYIKRDCY